MEVKSRGCVHGIEDPSSVVPGPFTPVIGISGSDQVDTLERAQWLEDEIGALDPDGVPG